MSELDGRELAMQRIALGVLPALFLLAGCTGGGSHISTGPAPEPFLATRRPPPPKVVPPKRETVRPEPQPERHAEWLPTGGIKRGRWQAIVVHHAATNKATPQGMNDYHRNVRKWSNGLGYHFVIGNGIGYPDGKIYVGNRWKQQLTGAHCKSGSGRFFGVWRPSNYFNEHGIGICLIGDFERERPTSRQLAALRELVQFLCDETGIPPQSVHGHGEVTHKTACPGDHLSVSTLRRSLHEPATARGRGATAPSLRGG